MRKKLAAAVRVLAHAGAEGFAWVLAGAGWGLLGGIALEAVFGHGTEGLLDAAGEAGLAGAGGALVGVLVGGTALVGSPALGGALGGALCERAGGRHPWGDRGRGLLDECSARSGAIGGALGGALVGPVIGAACGAGLALEAVAGTDPPYAFVQGAVIAGVLAGAVGGEVAAWRAVWPELPASVRGLLGALRPRWPGPTGA
jgi:hypothetical protein